MTCEPQEARAGLLHVHDTSSRLSSLPMCPETALQWDWKRHEMLTLLPYHVVQRSNAPPRVRKALKPAHSTRACLAKNLQYLHAAQPSGNAPQGQIPWLGV